MSEKFPYFAVARMSEYIEPIDRGDRYEDPLNARLQGNGLGEVTGGGSQLDSSFTITAVDVEIQLANVDDAIAVVTETLETQGAPKGSMLRYTVDGEERQVSFGRTEGVALVLDASLPRELWEAHAQEVWPALENLLKEGNVGELHGSKATQEVTEVYIYGDSRATILERLGSFRETFPLCKNSATRELNG